MGKRGTGAERKSETLPETRVTPRLADLVDLACLRAGMSLADFQRRAVEELAKQLLGEAA